MTINAELAARVLKQITEHPASHDQETWWWDAREWSVIPATVEPKCGSVGCVAGWACALATEKPSERVDWWEGGREVLGLSLDDACWLFSDNRSHGEVLVALAKMADGRSPLDGSQ